MSWAITATVVSIAATGYSAYTSREAGKQQQYNLNRQAEQEELSAESEEIVRRERLNKVLAANVASASASGNLEGSGQAISLESARKSSSSEGAASLSERLRQDLLRREGKAAASAGKTQAASTLLSGAARTTQLAK
jgi:hypothetical protein